MKKLRLMMLLVVAAAPAFGAHVESGEVEAAMQAALAEMKVDASVVSGSVHFAKAPSLIKAPSVIVERASILAGNQMEARLRCNPKYACLPFHALAKIRMSSATAIKRFAATTSKSVPRSIAALRPGDRVMFVRVSGGCRTVVQAVALDAGALGAFVRVRAMDGKREILRGRLCAEHVVRSEA